MTAANERLPRVSVVVPTYNRSGWLRAAVQSALDQSMSDIEVLVSDNGSTDDTAAVVTSFDDLRVSYLPLDDNIGMIANLDRCLSLGRAPYVCVLHDDDVMDARNLEAKVEVLDTHPDVVFAHSAFSYIDEDGQVIRDRMAWGRPIDAFESPATFIRRVFAAGSRVSPSGTVIRRSEIRNVHHEVDEKAANDVGLWLRLARYGTVAYLDTPLIALRRHSQSQTVSTGIRTLADAGGYAASFETIEQVRMVLDRFASRYGGDPVPARELRARARRSTRGRVATVIRHQAGSAGDRRELARLFARGLRVEPTLAVSADGVELLATIALGDGAASLVRRARPWLRSARAPFASSVRQTP